MIIPWDIVVNTLRSLGFNAMAGFVEFYKNRDKLIKSFSDNKKELVNIGKYQTDLFDKYNPHADPLIKELIRFGPDYLAYVVPEDAIEDTFDFFINLGRTLEIKKTIKKDHVLQQLAKYPGEFQRISKL